MIDIHSEPLLPLSEAASLVPAACRGKKTHLSTVLRWILDGVRGPDGTRVRLEGVRLGRRWMTTRTSLQRFAERLTPQIGAATTPPPLSHPATEGGGSRAELDRLGL
jgi:hypothetical protein